MLLFGGGPAGRSIAQPARQRTQRSFPLILRLVGQWCKRIRGKLYYFGIVEEAAYEQYLREAAGLHTGRQHGMSIIAAGPTINEPGDLIRPQFSVGSPERGVESLRDVVERGGILPSFFSSPAYAQEIQEGQSAMTRTEAIVSVLSVCTDHLRPIQAKALR